MSSTTEQNNCDVHLHAAAATAAAAAITEIEALKQSLSEKQNQLIAMETVCLRESDRQVELEDSVIAWQDKYDRLYESHKRVQKVNQNLEDKLLKLVDRNASERAQLTSDVATLSVRLAQANFNIAKLQREIERYKADINLAIQLLQCKPDSFVPQKVSSLPIDIQSKVSSYMRLETNSHSDSEGSTSGVGVATSASYKVLPASDSPPPAPCPFPPTAMVYSMRGLDGKTNTNSTVNLSNNNNNNSKESINNNTNNNNNATTTCHSTSTTTTTTTSLNNIATANSLSHNDPDMISPVTMAKFLEDELKAGEIKHCDTCQCSKQDLTVLADVSRSYTVATQTPFQLNSSGNLNEPLAQLCLRCNSNLNSPSRTNSPYLMKLVKSSDSVISETKSSVSDLNDMDKLFIPAKKDDLMVNPILGHHRLCDRTSGSGALSAAANQQHSLLNPGTKLTSTMLYPTTHLGAYAAEKYLLETSSLAGLTGQLRSGYHRRFVDGGGTALELLDKYEQKNDKLLEDLEADEAKPLLGSSMSHSSLMDAHKAKVHGDISEGIAHEQIKSPASTCSATKNSLMKTTISGSVNSLWSKTSSCDGAKMFENFNRNLIKTIKAENPKHRGPRLCAMRIQQNGQSNILLDNIESIEAVSPIIYKRRERLLDEELDDTKDVITSKTTSMPVSSVTVATLIEATGTTDEGLGATTDSLSSETDQWAKKARHNGIEEECMLAPSPTSDRAGGGSGEGKGGGVGVDGEIETTLASMEAKTEVKTAIDEVMVTTNNESTPRPDDVALLPDQNVTNSMMTVPAQFSNTELHAQLLENTSSSYEVLRNESSSKNSLQSKSCTQSSSISDVIDFQESVLLRRQQLSRVAEWVQNNTQQLEQQQQKQQQQVINAVNHCGDSSGTDRQSSFSTLDQLDSVSMEKLSMDSGYKTTPQPQTNGGYSDNQQDDANKSTEDSLSPKTDTNSSHNNNNNTNGLNNHHNNQHHQYHNPVVFKTNTLYRRTTRSGLPVAYTTTAGHNNDPNANGHHSIVMTAQPTCDILNYKYYPSETDKTRSIKAELHTTTKNVDIAQMEYNVKQFLLKQNEWSMRCSRPPGGPATLKGGTNTTTSSNLSSVASQAMSQIAAAQKIPTAAAVRHAKFFSNTSIGPGVGERVRMMPATGGGVGLVKTLIPNAEAPVMRPTIPQRTETNL